MLNCYGHCYSFWPGKAKFSPGGLGGVGVRVGRQQNQLTKGIQVVSEDPDQKLFTGHAERVRSDYVQDSNAADGIVPRKGLPLVLHS